MKASDKITLLNCLARMVFTLETQLPIVRTFDSTLTGEQELRCELYKIRTRLNELAYNIVAEKDQFGE